MISRFFIVCLGLFLSLASAYADQPRVSHRFFDTPNIALQGMNVAVQIGDYWSTERGLRNNPYAREANPLFQSPRARVLAKGAGIGVSLSLAYILHRAGAHKPERFVPVVIALPSGIAFAWNIHVGRQRNKR